MKPAKNPTFHISVDDVLPSLLDVSKKKIKLVEHNFFNTLRTAWDLYGVKTGLHLFYNQSSSGIEENLTDVRCLREELIDDWIYFGPHALNNENPPYCQSIEEQVATFEKINLEINRISPRHKSKSIRLHHYSECYENAEYFKSIGIQEIFTTDKPIGLHRFGRAEQGVILDKGYIEINELKLSRTHFRIENLANEMITKDKFLLRARAHIEAHNRIVIYSHEYEHTRHEVNEMFLNVAKWLTQDLHLECERP